MDRRAQEVKWHSVAFHLEICPHCSEVYAALVDLVGLAYGEQGVEPTRYPIPELPFLRIERGAQPQQIEVDWRLDELGSLVIRFSTELMHALRSPSHQAAYATAGLKSAKSRRILCQLSLKEVVEDLEVTITAEEQRDYPARCTVIAEVNVPSRGGWPNLAGTRVTLRRDKQELDTQWTDAFGKAVFEKIDTDDLPHLVFQIRPNKGHPDTQDDEIKNDGNR